MKFKVDENLPIEVAESLESAGHEATTVAAQGHKGADDRLVLGVCDQESRILITLDLGFADIRTYPPEQSPGVVVLRLRRQDKPAVLQVVARLVQVLPSETLAGRLWIVDEERIRIRG